MDTPVAAMPEYLQRLSVVMPGASPEALRTAVLAAVDVFETARVTPAQASLGAWIREGWDIRGFPEPGPTDEQFAWAKAWDEAIDKALRTFGLDFAPTGWNFIYELTPEDHAEAAQALTAMQDWVLPDDPTAFYQGESAADHRHNC